MGSVTRVGEKSNAEGNKPMSATQDTGHLSDVKTLRENARKHIEQGPLTTDYGADASGGEVLNEALATELVCVLRYKRHYFMAEGINVGAGGRRVPAARHGGAGARRSDRRAHRAAAGRAELQSRRHWSSAATPSTSPAPT